LLLLLNMVLVFKGLTTGTPKRRRRLRRPSNLNLRGFLGVDSTFEVAVSYFLWILGKWSGFPPLSEKPDF
jgi:hypothetical protein